VEAARVVTVFVLNAGSSSLKASYFAGERSLKTQSCTVLVNRVVRAGSRVRCVIEAAVEFAPAQDRAALARIDACAAAFPDVPQAADLDAAFHTTMLDEAAAYALPYASFVTRGIRRYGFHGSNHRYCAGRTVSTHPVTVLRWRGSSMVRARARRARDRTRYLAPFGLIVIDVRRER
jgi:acetate kinase